MLAQGDHGQMLELSRPSNVNSSSIGLGGSTESETNETTEPDEEDGDDREDSGFLKSTLALRAKSTLNQVE